MMKKFIKIVVLKVSEDIKAFSTERAATCYGQVDILPKSIVNSTRNESSSVIENSSDFQLILRLHLALAFIIVKQSSNSEVSPLFPNLISKSLKGSIKE